MNKLEPIQQYCPYCGELIELYIDCSIPSQEYIEDCRVCCQPIMINVVIDVEGDPTVSVRSENE